MNAPARVTRDDDVREVHVIVLRSLGHALQAGGLIAGWAVGAGTVAGLLLAGGLVLAGTLVVSAGHLFTIYLTDRYRLVAPATYVRWRLADRGGRAVAMAVVVALAVAELA